MYSVDWNLQVNVWNANTFEYEEAEIDNNLEAVNVCINIGNRLNGRLTLDWNVDISVYDENKGEYLVENCPDFVIKEIKECLLNGEDSGTFRMDYSGVRLGNMR